MWEMNEEKTFIDNNDAFMIPVGDGSITENINNNEYVLERADCCVLFMYCYREEQDQ